ncbi:SPOR domain-containing protein [Phaeobacter sp. J2-8]|uniref:SPOR domain-containing protein n=1 Tax=Phaeobacter sp. J2-8 TaxID=2931394 RepID=UPI0032AEECA9
MIRIFVTTFFALAMSMRAAFAQDDIAWIQVESLPSLLQAEERVRDYAENLPDVNGFSAGTGWYAIALGPYPENEAAQRLRGLRNARPDPAGQFRGPQQCLSPAILADRGKCPGAAPHHHSRNNRNRNGSGRVAKPARAG